MKITVVAMRMMQMAINQIIHMITMRNRLMPASRAVDMASLMPGTCVAGRALGGVCGADLQHMLIDMPAVDVMQMTIVQIIGMTGVVDGQMSATRAMLMLVIVMFLAGIHVHPPVMIKTSTSV